MCSPSPIIKSLGDSYLIYTENRNHLRVSLCVAGNLLVAYSVILVRDFQFIFSLVPKFIHFIQSLNGCSSPWKIFVSSVVSGFCDPMDCSLPGFSVHGILQARVFPSRGSSQPRSQTQVPCIAGRFFTFWTISNTLKIYFEGWYFLNICFFALLSWLTWVSSNIWRDAK